MNKLMSVMFMTMFCIVGHSQSVTTKNGEISFNGNEVFYNGKKYVLQEVSKNNHVLKEVDDSQSFNIGPNGEFICDGKNYVVKEYKGVKSADLYKRFSRSYKEFKKKYSDGSIEAGIDEIRYYIDIESSPAGLKVEYLFKTTIQIDFKDEKIRISPSLDKIMCTGGLYNYNYQVLGISEFFKKNGQMKSGQKGEALFHLCGSLNQAISDILRYSENVTLDEDW